MLPNIVELTLLDGKKIHVNLDLASAIEHHDDHTEIIFSVKERVSEIYNKEEVKSVI